ncbi:SRPBCC family protein [Streptomyces sp. LaPpAH-108]|uniref:SRPBCC family protein n=1 Tax=Streptomyces sp. LaPpAH-108 TaxID=1155714 RepID=UPI000380D679|nr:SRPBCC domain-containing protein [Streptomyces sp. LaPpAH-108]
MEHQVFVPVPADRLREALADPVRVARAVPGLQQDATADPLTGRLKLRVGGHSVTYRGTAGVTRHEDGSYTVQGEATESRGTGSAEFTVTVRLAEAADGTTADLTATATTTTGARTAELPADQLASAAARLLTRFLEGLAEEPQEPVTPPVPETPEELEQPEQPEVPEEPGAEETAADAHTSVFDTEVPPPSLTPDPAEPPAGPPAEAAHARRTMIGRSAEEVDHAPPRGRYAPVPAPQAVTAHSTLRWAAPAAAFALASAIVVTRALRKRR